MIRAARTRALEEEARMKIAEPRTIICAACRTPNEVDGNGVPKAQCSGCGKILVLREPARPRLESR
jgi:hypothetical protein